jgi:hypothetical protein
MESSPPFSEALKVFTNFLRKHKVSDTVRWIWREAIISRMATGTQHSYSLPIYLDAARLADEVDIESYYNVGVGRGFGITLSVFCIADGIPYCFVDLPENESDADYKMMSTLKCSMPIPTPTARLIRNSVHSNSVPRLADIQT